MNLILMIDMKSSTKNIRYKILWNGGVMVLIVIWNYVSITINVLVNAEEVLIFLMKNKVFLLRIHLSLKKY